MEILLCKKSFCKGRSIWLGLENSRLLTGLASKVEESTEMEFKEFEPRFKSAKTRFKFSAGLNLETFDTILSGTNHI